MADIKFSCPQCGVTFRIREEFAGKKVRCPKCTTVSAVPATVVANPAPPPAPAKPAASAPAKAGPAAAVSKKPAAKKAPADSAAAEAVKPAPKKENRAAGAKARDEKVAAPTAKKRPPVEDDDDDDDDDKPAPAPGRNPIASVPSSAGSSLSLLPAISAPPGMFTTRSRARSPSWPGPPRPKTLAAQDCPITSRLPSPR